MEYLALGIALGVVVLFVYYINMINKKFKEVEKLYVNVLKLLEIKVNEEYLEKRLSNHSIVINNLLFRSENPPKYKVGDKAPDKGWIVNKAEAVDDYDYPSDGKLVSGPKYKGLTSRWQYTSTNIKTGETKTWAE